MDSRTALIEAAGDSSKIPGWGSDADAANDPTYPYRDRSADDGPGMNWERPPQQEPHVEILQSIEHERLPAVVGTSIPPSGISGMIRRVAFKYSESNWAHWLLLMGADRINVVEGLFQDLGRGKIPNIPAEMGLKSEWKHNKTGLATKVAVGAAVTAGIFLVMRALSNGSDQRGSGGRDSDGRLR